MTAGKMMRPWFPVDFGKNKRTLAVKLRAF
jgi:hypothetical protein